MALTTNYEPIVITDTTNLSEAEWLEYRRKGIGGSDVAAVLGLSPFCTARDLYCDKTGIKPAIVECKTTNYNNQDKWYNGAIPINYELQVRHCVIRS